MMATVPDDFQHLLTKAKALVDSVSFDDSGMLVGSQLVGGHGGLISRETLKAADELRREIEAIERNGGRG